MAEDCLLRGGKMKNIQNYDADKYWKTDGFCVSANRGYKKIESGIYEYEDEGETIYTTSLSFEQEPEYGEGKSAADISQYPLEDILDRFCCFISDFYDEINTPGSSLCYQEFASASIEDIRNLRSIIGKHVYNRDLVENGTAYVELVIEQEKGTGI